MEAIEDLAVQVVREFKRLGLVLTTVESCTGGGIVNAITNVPGSSAILVQAFVTYSTEAKKQLGVPARVIDRYSIYSTETAVAMVQAGLKAAVRADIGIATTGSLVNLDAQNDGSVIGEVYLAVGRRHATSAERLLVPVELSRAEAKLYIVESALRKLLSILGDL